MPDLPPYPVQAAPREVITPEEAIVQALLRWSEPVSRNAHRIAQAALAALDGHGYPVGPPQRRTVLGGQPAIDVSFEGGRWVLRLPCLCCGEGQISVRLTPGQARDLAETLGEASREEMWRDEPV